MNLVVVVVVVGGAFGLIWSIVVLLTWLALFPVGLCFYSDLQK